MDVSVESHEATHNRLLQVIAEAKVRFYEGLFAYEEFPLGDPPLPRVLAEALALVRDDEVWSVLIPARESDREPFELVRFHFPAGLDNSGFVGWLASILKEATGSGVLVVCGQNSRDGGIFDYWGFPAEVGERVRIEIERLRRKSRSARAG